MKGKMGFVEGQEVEVENTEEGLEGSLFTATVRRFPNNYTKKMKMAAKGKIYVEYLNILNNTESGKLKEAVNVSRVRPLPPKDTTSLPFKVDDEVDALYNDGWWKGVIRKVSVERGLIYSVFFEGFNEEMVFVESDVRKHHEWVDGKWVSSHNQEAEVRTQNEENGKFPSLSGRSALDTDTTILKDPSGLVDSLSKYVTSSRRTRGRMNNKANSNEVQPPSNAGVSSHETVLKKVRDKQITKAPTSLKPCHARERSPTDAQHAFSFPAAEGKHTVRDVEDSEGTASSKHRTNSQKKQRVAIPTGLLEEPSSKTVGGKDQTKKAFKRKRGQSMSSGLEDESAIEAMTVISTDTQELSHTEEEHSPFPLQVKKFYSPNLEDKKGLEDEAAIEAVAVISTDIPVLSHTVEHHRPLPLQVEESNSPNLEDKRERHSSPVQRGKITQPFDNGDLPFTKKPHIWEPIESSEVFKSMPQQPHFRPLEQHIKILREGHAIGYMYAFISLVEGVQRTTLEEPKSTFEEMMEALKEFENLGFNVKRIRTRLERLLEIKERSTELNERARIAQREFIEANHGEEEVDKYVEEMKMELEEMKLKRDRMSFEIAELEKGSKTVKGDMQLERLRFDTLVASPLVVKNDSR